MSEVEDFLASMMPLYVEAETKIHEGDAGPRFAMWSRNEPVTLFGAAVTKKGWPEVAPVFDWLASSFSDCSSYRNDVIAAGASGDLAYIVAIEHTETSIEGERRAYALRATTVFRREEGGWKVIHRHADPVASQPEATLADAVSGTTR